MDITDTFKKVATINADEAKKLLAEKTEGEVTLIDVREPEEYEEGHLPGAVLMPLSELLDRVKELDPSKPAITYCRMGNRSRSAAALLMTHGFDKVSSIDGGITAWKGLVASGQYEAGMFLIEGRKTAEEFTALAWALENGTGAFYMEVEEFLQDQEAKGVFESLIKAELKHKEKLLEAYSLIKGIPVTHESLRKEGLEGIMEGGVSVENTLSWVKSKERTLQDILEISMQIETNSLDLYVKILREIEDEGAKKVFNLLIGEERTHLSRLGRLLESKLKAIP